MGTGGAEHYALGFGDNRLVWFVNTTGGMSNPFFGSQAVNQQWIHVSGTYDGAWVRLYVNGVEQFATPHTGTLRSDTRPLTIGGNVNTAAGGAEELFWGRIDDVRLYNRALTPAEIQTLYTSGGGNNQAPTVSITAPADGASYTAPATIGLTATAADTDGTVAKVEYFQGTAKIGEATAAPYSVNWTNVAAGTYQLTAKAIDNLGSAGTSAVVQVIVGGNGSPVKIMPLGDSITEGTGYTGEYPGAYRVELWPKLLTAGYNVDFVGTRSNGPVTIDRDHEGRSGWRIDDVAQPQQIDTWLAATQPKVVLLKLGTNDMLDAAGGWETASSRLSALIDRILAQVPGVHVVVASIIPFGNSVYEQRALIYNAGVADAVAVKKSQGKKVSFVDMHSAVPVGDLLADGIHPTVAGFGKMATAWFAELERILIK
jgi:lysophospholipase L1-like esterase